MREKCLKKVRKQTINKIKRRPHNELSLKWKEYNKRKMFFSSIPKL